jgi:hypothetical protein
MQKRLTSFRSYFFRHLTFVCLCFLETSIQKLLLWNIYNNNLSLFHQYSKVIWSFRRFMNWKGKKIINSTNCIILLEVVSNPKGRIVVKTRLRAHFSYRLQSHFDIQPFKDKIFLSIAKLDGGSWSTVQFGDGQENPVFHCDPMMSRTQVTWHTCYLVENIDLDPLSYKLL